MGAGQCVVSLCTGGGARRVRRRALTPAPVVRAQEYDASMMQDIYNQITAKCFQKCIGKPGDRLDKEEQKCLAKCIDRYLDSREVQARHPMARAEALPLRARRRAVPLRLLAAVPLTSYCRPAASRQVVTSTMVDVGGRPS